MHKRPGSREPASSAVDDRSPMKSKATAMDVAERPPTQPTQEDPKQEQVQGEILSVEDSLTRLNLQDEKSSDGQSEEAGSSATIDEPLTDSGDKTVETRATNSRTIGGSKENNDKESADPGEASGKPSETTGGDLTQQVLSVVEDEHLFDPSNLNDPWPSLDIDEELLSALRSLQVEDDLVDNQDEPFDLLPRFEDDLEDLEVNPEERELLPLQDYSDVFDEEEPIEDSVGSLIETIDNLAVFDTQGEDDELSDEQEFPWYLLCRPCQPDDGTAQQYTDPTEGPTDEELLQLSLLAMAGNYNHALDDDNDYGENVYEDSFQSYIVSRRREAVEAAMTYTISFGTGLYQPPFENQSPINERSCLGHKETIYGVNFSGCGKYLATASQDATVCVWDVATNSLLSTLTGHSKDYECLRTVWAPSGWPASSEDNLPQLSFIASGGADGIVKIWRSPDPSKKNSWECIATLDHSLFEGRTKASDDDDGIPQIYALQFIDQWQGLASEKNDFLMTSSDDYVHLWEMNKAQGDDDKLCFSEVFSIRFTAVDNVGSGVSVSPVTSAGLKVPDKQPSSNSSNEHAFGGERNPSNVIYVFDASYCPGNGLLGVALSDGSMRLVNGRGVCVSVLSLPGCKSHLTSFTWDSTGSRLASCVATGHLILWSIENREGQTVVSCCAVLEGGHQPGRPLFGAQYCGVDNEDLIVSWGVDGRLCLWDSHSHGQIHAPISTLISRQDYPIYAVDISHSVLAVGGGRDAGFLGMPLSLYNVDSNNDREEITVTNE